MKGYINKYKFIQILFAVAVILLIANLLVARFTSEIGTKPSIEYDKEFSATKIDSIFLSSLKKYNIQQSWIHKTISKKNRDKSSLPGYKINIPYDLPNILLIREIYKNFSRTKLKIVSKEININGNSSLKIFNSDKLILSALFNYNKDISHVAGYLNLFIVAPDELNEKDERDLLNSKNKITLLFLPSTRLINLANNIKANDLNFALIININIEELKFKIKNSYDEDRIMQGVNAILESFPTVNLVFVSSNFNPNYKIRSAFNKRGVKLLYQKKLINFTKEYKSNFKKLFNSYVTNTTPNDTLNVVLSIENFKKIKNDLSRYGKLGYKFVTY